MLKNSTSRKSKKKLFALCLVCMTCSWIILCLNFFIKDSATPVIGKANTQHRISLQDLQMKQTEEMMDSDSTSKVIVLENKIPDYRAWLEIPNTLIDYAVVQSQDPSFYLDHDIYQNDSPYGSIFMDSECSLSDPVITIHGHHMINENRMFTPLLQYQEDIYLDEYRFIQFNENQYEILGCMQIDTMTQNDRIYMYYLNDYDDFHRIKKINEIFTKAEIEIPSLKKDDKFLLLSTCLNTEGIRWIVFSRMT